jgi:stress-induced morphogen
MKMSGYTRLNIYFDPEYISIADASGDDQEHIVFNNNRGDDNSYKLLVVNTDFQQSQTLDIKINDSYVQPPVITPSTARVFRPT